MNAFSYLRIHGGKVPVSAIPAEPIGLYSASSVQSRILNHLRLKAGRFVSMSEMIEAVYPDPDLEPSVAGTNIGLAVMKLRARGFPIESRYRWGYRFVPMFNEVADLIERAG